MMAIYHRNSEKRRIGHEFRRQEEEVIGSLCRLANRPISPKTQMEQEKRIRREIANSNERRRMQSINAGFQSLRTLLPHHEGEKLSKAAILQHTADYIYQLEQEKTRLLAQNCQLKRILNTQMNLDSDGSSSDSPLPKRRKAETEASESLPTPTTSPSSAEPSIDDLGREMIELRVQLDRERRLRMMMEEQTRNLEAQLYPERIREITHQVQLQYQHRSSDGESPSQVTIEQIPTSPQSQLPLSDTEPKREIATPPTPQNSSEETLASEAPQDLSGRSHTSSSEMIEVITSTSTTSVESPPPANNIEQTTSHIYPASTSRQNLETIVEAIRHLEGDHLFQDDSEPLKLQTVSLLNLPLDSCESNGHTDHVIHLHASSTASEQHQRSISAGNSEYAIRQQVIQFPLLNQSRPGVIVATHS
ncbi:transcription factor AP-4 isoform X1 [Centruroides vittatus]|uniref:transcription factor AP-4 isoform X1 n=2 Tax=Centruroides vittatus TaxID=120091 RepID=UPI00350F17A6